MNRVPKNRNRAIAAFLGFALVAAASAEITSVPRLKLQNFDQLVRETVKNTYSSNEADLLWFDDDGLTVRGNQALMTMLRGELQGIDQPGLKRFVRRAQRISSSDDARVLATDAQVTARLVALGMRMRGLDRLRYTQADFPNEYQKPDAEQVLTTVLSTPDPIQLLDKWQPRTPGFEAMQVELEKYRGWADAALWPTLTGHSVLEEGDEDPEVKVLKQRLQAEGFAPVAGFDADTKRVVDVPMAAITVPEPADLLQPSDSAANPTAEEQVDPEQVFSPELVAALKRYQQARGLAVDGVLGPNTRDSLNISPMQRVRQIQWNLVRRRGLPHDLGDHYVWANIPEYKLRVIRDGETTFTSRTVVGKRQHATPVFIDHIEYMEVNPYWNVPQSIAAKEIAPKMRRDPSYIDRNDMEVLESWAYSAKVVPSRSIDWNAYRGWSSGLPFRIRQRPGEKNALGRVKFIFPNDYSVYLHDTPSDHLFDEPRRSFSHGCVRVARPFDFAEYILANNRQSEKVDFQAILDSKVNTRLNLDKPLPVYIVYFSAWVDDEGQIQFRDDLYGHDRQLASELAEEVKQLKAYGLYAEAKAADALTNDFVSASDSAIAKRRAARRQQKESALQ